MKYPIKHGFSLIELLIAILVLSVITVFAYPSYQHYVAKTHRTDGQVALMDLSARMERYYQQNNHSFVNATPALLGVNTTTPGGYYNLNITNLSTTTYLLQANPIGTQLRDDALCGTLTVDQLGQKGITGKAPVAECW